MSTWPATGNPWREPLGPQEVANETTYLRVACWIVIAYLSGMRDAEVRELPPDCAFTEPGPDGRTRFKIRGRVLKGRKLTGDLAEWVVLPVVHEAIMVLRRLNDDPTHLFAHTARTGPGLVLFGSVDLRLNNFRDHLNSLFGTLETPFIPDVASAEQASGEPWRLTARQFRRTLAWHIAHQPFGIVAGSRQYQHAELAVFEGYAGTSASGFAAEVESQRKVARLDYVEDLYRDWNTGHRSGGAAAARIDEEFARVRRELGDLPGVVASPARLRAMLAHLTKTLHPGVLNDCFYQPAQAACATRAKPAGRPLPLLNMCLHCPNARRSTVHLPALIAARDQIQAPLAARHDLPRLQALALTEYSTVLQRLITELAPSDEAARP